MNHKLRTMNEQGLSSLVLLIFIVLGVFIAWEANEFVNHYSSLGQNFSASCPSGIPGDCFDTDEGEGSSEPICQTGEADNCNDSNDVFLLTE